MSRLIRWSVRTPSLWCGVVALLAPLLWAGSAYGAPAGVARQVQRQLAPARHEAVGIDFGGRELRFANPPLTDEAIRLALAKGPLPPGAQVQGDTVRVPNGAKRFQIRVQPTAMPGTLPYAPVATFAFRGPDEAVVKVSDRAMPDLIEQAVVARVNELAVTVSDRARNSRPDVTSALVEGLLTTARPDGMVQLSPKDVGRVRGLQTVADRLGLDPDPYSPTGATALATAITLGLLDQDPARPPHTMRDNRPVAGQKAAEARVKAIRQLDNPAKAAVNQVLTLAKEPEAKAQLDDLRAERNAIRADLRVRTDRAITARERADDRLTHRLRSRELPVLKRVIVGGGWAATADYLTLVRPLPSPSPTGGVPQVLAVSSGYGVVNNLGDFRLTQPPMDMELPGAPFQPVDFAKDRNDFTFSTAFGRAVGAARAEAGMPTYHAKVLKVDARKDKADADAWPAEAAYRVTLNDRALFAESVDVASGLGPPRIPEADRNGLAGRTFTDPDTGYQAAWDRDGKLRVLDPRGWEDTALPDTAAWLLGVEFVGGAPRLIEGRGPFLLDPQGRPTERRVVDTQTQYSVDPVTQEVLNSKGTPVKPQKLPADLSERLGFRQGGYRDPRFVPDPEHGLSVHPVTGALIGTATGDAVSWDTLRENVRTALNALIRSHRAQFGGWNTEESYRTGEDVFVIGGGAGGASEVEQAIVNAGSVTWGARVPRAWPGKPEDYPKAPDKGGLDPVRMARDLAGADGDHEKELRRDLSLILGGGFNRRNTAPGYAAYSENVWNRVTRTTTLPTLIRYTTDHRFHTDAERKVHDRLVYSIGQEAAYPGGAAALFSSSRLGPLYGPGGELNGLGDAGGLRVIGAASVTRSVLGRTGSSAQALGDIVRRQAHALPGDARDIAASIRYHAGRIAELNRPRRS
jgi:hypothetical protein